MKYFGCLEPDFFKNQEKNKVIDYLIEKELFELKAEAKQTNFKDGILELTFQDTLILEPTQDLLDEFYIYIMDKYKNKSILHKFEFFQFFNNEIYGNDLLTKKAKGLIHFKRIYADIYIDSVTFLDNQISKNGITHTTFFSKLKMLYFQQNAFKYNLANAISVNQYLLGNQDFFNENDFFSDNIIEKYRIVKEIIKFETWLQILVELNDLFGFEDDYCFTNRKTDIDKFNKYLHIFKSLESYQFTDRKIKSFEKDKKAHIESLYEVLITNELIFDQRLNFISFVEKEYEFGLSKIISYIKKKNFIHDERVELFNEEWQQLTSKKD